MIFVTLGTQGRGFNRLLKMVEDLIREYKIKDVIAQVGYTHYHSDFIKCVSFIPYDEYEHYMSEAEVIITHAGTGAIFSSLKKGKKVIAVARLKKYGEMVNDHQTEIVKKLSKEGYLIDGTDSLIEAWKRLDTFVPRKCDFECTLPTEIGKIIDEWIKN